MLEATMINYIGRYDEICHHWRGNILDSKSRDLIGMKEKAKAKTCH